MDNKYYTTLFYDSMCYGSYNSAKEIVPIVYNLLKPKSVIDVGCAVGAWLKVFEELGVTDICGLEGDYIKKIDTFISKDKIVLYNLKNSFYTDKKYDIAVSLELAEHLPNSSSKKFIEMLTSLSNIVLFSAAIRGQAGTHHINEQLPEYWAKHFAQFDFVPIDYIRPLIWDNKNIDFWYKQNILLFVKKEILNILPVELQKSQAQTHSNFLFKIHPERYNDILKMTTVTYQIKKLFMLPFVILKKIKDRLFKHKLPFSQRTNTPLM